MKSHVQRITFALIALLFTFAYPAAMYGQNIISGEITGIVTDPTQAVVPAATATLTSLATGEVQTATTGDSGSFRFPLLRPGDYTLVVSAKGFVNVSQKVTAAVGQVTSANVQMQVGTDQQTVEVTAAPPLLDTDSANIATTFTPSQIENLPNPGGDLTNYALATPGVVLSTGSGYGNFTAFGMPGTSNLYTVNGGDMNDPYNNLNNSGSSNNMLGVNEIQEVAMVHNGYTGQYGRGASVNMNFTTKSGENSFHGNAKWDWNGRYLNANDWFNNDTDTPRPFANSNQWGGSIGGPIIKNKLFFFYDNEGLRYILPSGGFPVYIPTTAFANAVTAQIASSEPGELATYQKMIQLYAGAPGGSAATPLSTSTNPNNPGTGGCGDLSFQPAIPASGSTPAVPAVPFTPVNGINFGEGGQACTKTFRTSTVNLNKERLQSIRGDYVISGADHLTARYWQDRGQQPTFTDPINSAFNALSTQPQDAAQVTETHVFSPTLLNQLIVGGFYYSAVFGPANLAASEAVFPVEVGGEVLGGNNCTAFDGSLSCMGGEYSRYKSGRNVTQYQIVDDVSWTDGPHAFKFGLNFRREDYADFTPATNTTGLVNLFSMTDFSQGVLDNGSNVTQVFSNTSHYQLNSYSLGMYAQDEWQARRNLKLTLALRGDRNSNITCLAGCFAEFVGGFSSISHDASTPYNQSIKTGNHQLLPGLERIVWEPRFGFAWSPAGSQNTVVRGGIGIFSDLFPQQMARNVIANAPTVATFLITGTPMFGPGGGFAQAAANNAAFQSAFTSGGTLASIKTASPAFTGPNMYDVVQNFRNARYAEWNFEVQHSFGAKTMASINYVGNHGSHEIVLQNGLNAYSTTTTGAFGTLPIGAAPDPRFGRVRQVNDPGISNYNGLTLSVTTHVARGLQVGAGYTYSKAMDDISNGGINQYSFNQFGDSALYQTDPKNLRLYNYGPSDYNFTQVFNLNYVYEIPFSSSSRLMSEALSGWVVSGALYKRTGQPYSVFDSGAPSTFLKNDSSGYIEPLFLGGPVPSCKVNIVCLNSSQFSEANSNGHVFGNLSRNHFVGPGYFNTDLSIKKNFQITESGLAFEMGANAYNVLNHAHFGNPVNDLSSDAFGTVVNTVVPASSPYGNFQGAAVSGRILQLELQVKF